MNHQAFDPGDPIFVIFGKEQVRRRRGGEFLKKFGEAGLPSGPALARLHGRFSFMVDGFDDRPDEAYAIPEVRRFYRMLLRKWPAWFYFCDLRTEGLLMMTACCLDDFDAMARIGSGRTNVAMDPVQLLKFISDGFAPMNRMFERAGASEAEICRRTGEIMRYYGLPFDAPGSD